MLLANAAVHRFAHACVRLRLLDSLTGTFTLFMVVEQAVILTRGPGGPGSPPAQSLAICAPQDGGRQADRGHVTRPADMTDDRVTASCFVTLVTHHSPCARPEWG